jgi:hypothetical protein
MAGHGALVDLGVIDSMEIARGSDDNVFFSGFVLVNSFLFCLPFYTSVKVYISSPLEGQFIE